MFHFFSCMLKTRLALKNHHKIANAAFYSIVENLKHALILNSKRVQSKWPLRRSYKQAYIHM